MKKFLDQFSRQLNALLDSVEKMRTESAGPVDECEHSAPCEEVVPTLLHYLSVTPDRNHTLLTTALRCAMTVVEAGGAGLTLYDPDKGKLVFKAALGDGAEGIIGYEVPLKGSRHGLAFATGEVQSATPIHDGAEQVAQTEFKNVLVAPLLVDDEAIGTISAVNKQSGDHFTPDDMARYQAFAELLATIIRQDQRRQLVEQLADPTRKQPEVLQKLSLRDEDRQLISCLLSLQKLSARRPSLVPVVQQLADQLVDDMG